MKNFVSKKDTLNFLYDNCSKIEEKLNSVSDELYTGKTFSREELLSLNCDISSIIDIINDIANVIDFIFNREKSIFKKFKIGVKVALVANVMLFVSGSPLLAIILTILQYTLYKMIEEEHDETIDYLALISDKGINLNNRAENYEETIDIKIKKKLEIKEELDADEELKSKFDAALTVMGYLLRGYEVDEIDSELENLIKEILIEGGADGETLEELVNNMRVKIDSLNGGNALKKD